MRSIDRRLSRSAAILAAGLALGACGDAAPEAAADGGRVPTYRGNASRTGEMPGPGPEGEQPTIAWTFEAGGAFHNSPVVAGGTVFTASGDGSVHARDLATGQERWSIDLGVGVSASPLLIGDLVVIGDKGGTLQARRTSDGSAAWSVETDGPITGSPAVTGDDLIVATGGTGTHAYRLEATTGATVWATDVGQATIRSVAVGDVAAYLGVGDEVVAIALEDGAERWRATVAGSGTVGTPTIAGDLVYASVGNSGDPGDAGVAAIDAATGEVRWTYASPDGLGLYTPAVVNGRAYVLGHDRQVVAMDAADGSIIWTRTFDHELEALPSIVGDTLYVVANDGPAAALDAETGNVRWSVDIDGIPFAPAIVDGYLLVGTNLGYLYAIGGP